METHPIRFLWVFAFAMAWGSVLAASLVPPALPPEAAAQPIALEPGTSETIALGNVIFRIATGTPIGNVYQIGRNKVVREDRWTATSGRVGEFDVAMTDRLRQLGYSVVDPTQSAFAAPEPAKARYQLGGIVSRLRRDYHFKYSTGYIGLPEEGYGVGDLDVEFQILDQMTNQIVFRKSYTGYGTDVGKNPGPVIPAFMNALDHALADPAFTTQLRKPSTPGSAAAAGTGAASALRIPACQREAGTRLPDHVDRIIPAVVTLRIGGVSGTGIVVSPQGYVLTAAHLVTGATGITATLSNGMEFDASVLRVDAARDVAVLQLPGRGHPCVPVSTAVTLKVGGDVFVVGSPLGKTFANSVTRGVLSGERVIDGTKYLQTDASVNPGSSGGPLLDAQGRVQGIVSSKIAAPGIEGLAFGVPVEVLARELSVTFY